ncbi:MAG: T9SS type A sorting domain-containing protein [Flavobacteriales bacterium]
MKFTFSLALLFMTTLLFGKTWVVTVSSGPSFSVATLTITEGDSVTFSLGSPHNATEVSQSTWNANGSTALPGGFFAPTGGGTILPAKLTVGTHYYVCTPHASMGMKAQIIVQAPTGFNEKSSTALSIYPNPVSDQVSIKSGKSNFGTSFFLFDLTGRQVHAGKLVNEYTTIDMSQLQSGVYFLQVGTEAKQTFKVIKN